MTIFTQLKVEWTIIAALALSPGASESEIRKAYRKLARKYHPYVSREADAEERFIEITEAYEYLLEKRSGPSVSYSSIFETPVPELSREELRRQSVLHPNAL